MSNASNLTQIEKTLIDGISDYFSLMTREGSIVAQLDAVIVAHFPLDTPFIDENNPTLAGRVEWAFQVANSEQNNDGIPEALKLQPEGQIFPFAEISKLTHIAKQVEVQATLTFTLQSSDKIEKLLEFSIKV